MAELPAHARTVVIGGGAVGVSCLFHLAKKGWTDSVLVEKDELTSGSTWHAAGNVPTFSTSWAVMNLQRYSAELYRGLADETGYPIDYHVTGSVRLAHSADRMREFERVAGMGRYQGMDVELCTAGELRAHYPFLETHGLEGALLDPCDGDIDPAQLTQALARGARRLGAAVVRFCPVTDVRREGGEWVLRTPQGEIRCEYVVNAAGYRAREVGALFGRSVPMVAMSHQYLLTEPIPELEAWTKESGRKLPLLRDVDTSWYLRQEKSGLNLGPYERECRAHWVAPGDPMPEDFSFQLFPDDLDRLEPYIEDAVARVPILGTGGVSRVINGPIPYAPDGNPLVGPMPGAPNAFEACVFTFGIAQAGGAGKVLAEWVADGGTEWDMWACDPRRFTAYADQKHTLAKAMEVYGHEYAMHFPHHAWPAGRGKRLSPAHGRVGGLGAEFGAYGGWERANWFAHAGDDTSQAAARTWVREGPWFARVREECLAVRDAAGLLDLPGFSRFHVAGRGAAEWLRSLVTGELPSVGRVGLLYFADERGRIVTEMSATRLGEDELLLISAAAAQWHDREWLERHLPAGGGGGGGGGDKGGSPIRIEDRTEAFCCQILAGPESREILRAAVGGPPADLERSWLTWQRTRIADREAMLLRVSFAGELGWEVHSRAEDTPAVFDALWEAGRGRGLRPFGMFALDSLRLEKGYRAWKGDLSTDYTVLEGGLERFVRWDKPGGFLGRSALEEERERRRRKEEAGEAAAFRRFATLVVDAGDCDAPYMSTVWSGGEVVGETTSGGWGHRVEASIALAMLRADLARPGAEVEVEVYGERRPAVVQPDRPLYDPDNRRPRG